MIFSVQISDEKKLLLELAKPFFSDLNIQKIEAIISGKSSLNWNEVFRLSFCCEVSGFVYKNSKNLDFFPKDLREKMKRSYQETGIRNILALKETLSLLNVLSGHDLPVIPLKGVFFSDRLLEDFGVYPSGDIDILVNPKHLSATKKILCSQSGYSPVEQVSESDLLENHYHLILKKRMVLEIHWNLVKRYFNIPAEYWWETAQQVDWHKIPVMDLSVENNILYNAFRLFDHCFHPLRFFVLLAAVIEKNFEIIEWRILIDIADFFKMKKMLVFTLMITNELLDTRIPGLIIREKTIGYRIFKSLVFSGIFSGVERKHFRMMIYTLILIDFRIVIKVFMGRLFPSKAELRLRYNLPASSKKVYLYYMFNPVLLFLKSENRRTNA